MFRIKSTKRERREWLYGYAMVAPLIIGLCVFYFYPFIQSIYMSFTKNGGIQSVYLEWNCKL